MAAATGPAAMRWTWLKTKMTGQVSATLSGRHAARLWFTPWRIPESDGARARRSEWLEGTKPISVPAGESELKGFTAGEGPIVLLVHGWGDRASSLGAFIDPLVRRGYRVVGVDLPGHGDTSGGMTDAYKLAEALREAAWNLGNVHAVITHSMGAVSTMLAIRDGLTVYSIVLISPAVRLERGLAQFLDMYKLPSRAGRGLRAEIERRYGETIWHDIAVDKIARHVDVPALVIHDVHDTQVSIEDSRLLVSSWPSARLHVTAGLGHKRVLRDEDVVQRTTAFLEGSLIPA